MFSTSTIITTAPDQYQKALEAYSSIVEKTNSQLGLWLSVGNYMVTILGVIVAVIAIYVAVVIYRNSKEQKEKFEAFLEKQKQFSEARIKEFEEESKKRREASERALEVLIEEQGTKLKSATEDNKKDIEKAIADLKKTKATIGTISDPNPLFFQPQNNFIYGINNDPGSTILNSRGMTCSVCGNYFSYRDNSLGGIYSGSLASVHCTHCGALNIPSLLN